MNRKILIEGALLILMGCLGIVEGLRLESQVDTQSIQGPVGPGAYMLFPSILLVSAGIVYLFGNYRNKKTTDPIKKETGKKQALGIIVVLALYIFLMDICGYLLASVVFFLLEFRIVGVQSWAKNMVLTGIIVGVYYTVFVYFCSMSFPRGILFG